MIRRSSSVAWPAKLPFGGFLTGLFSAKRRATDLQAARAAKVLALESLERRELLFGSGGSAWITFSTDKVPEGAPVVVLMEWGNFGTSGGTITYTSGGATPEVPRDHDFVQGSKNVGVSGSLPFAVTTAADDKGCPEDFSDAFFPHARRRQGDIRFHRPAVSQGR